jgi:hypothetical protein
VDGIMSRNLTEAGVNPPSSKKSTMDNLTKKTVRELKQYKLQEEEENK